MGRRHRFSTATRSVWTSSFNPPIGAARHGETKLLASSSEGGIPARVSVQLGLGTADIDNFHAAGQAEGLIFTSPPSDMHGTRIARFRDPDGAETR